MTDARKSSCELSTHAAPQHEREIRLPTGAWRLMRDSRNQIWAAAFGGGLLRVRDPLRQRRHRRTLTITSIASRVHRDRCSRIAKATSGSACAAVSSACPNVPSRSVTQLEGLTNDGVRTATVGSDGSVWVATGHA